MEMPTVTVELKLEEMGSRVPVQQQQHYNVRAPNSFIGSTLHDLNTVDARPADIESISDVDRDAVTEDSLDINNNNNGSSAVVGDCMHESYTNSLPIHRVRAGVKEDGSCDGGSSSLSLQDVSPIESARARFLLLIVDHFISEHVIEVPNSEAAAAAAADYNGSQSGQDKLSKRKHGEVRYEGDPTIALPLMYIANMYQTLVNDVNSRLASLSGFREKTIGVALEASGGLYRCLAKKFPKTGSCTFRRRELATSLETRTKFPELVVQEEKRIRFVVVNGLDIAEKPTNMPAHDAEWKTCCLGSALQALHLAYRTPCLECEVIKHMETRQRAVPSYSWFRRLTGRNEVAVSARDFKFYSPRHKYRRERVASNSAPNIPLLPTFPGTDSSSMLAAAQGFRSVSEPQNQQMTPCKLYLQPLSHQPQFQQTHHQSMNQSPHAVQYSQNRQCGATSHLPETAHAHHSPTMPQHMAILQGGHVGGRLHVLPSSPAKFCDECGVPYLRETSKFCSECGVKRLGV